MNIQNLAKERVIGNIKIGTKKGSNLPKKLDYFNVEEDKVTSEDIVDIFKQLYPNKPTKLKIRFINEEPLKLSYKRYVNHKAVCIGNGNSAKTIGKDSNGKRAKVDIVCNEECPYAIDKTCRLNGSLKFVLDGIEAGGIWSLSTTGKYSLRNIASEIFKYQQAKMSIVNVPFELSLNEVDDPLYGIYYTIDLRRTDIKPMLTTSVPVLESGLKSENEIQQLSEGKQEKQDRVIEEQKEKVKEVSKAKEEIKEKETKTFNNKVTEDFSNCLMVKEIKSQTVNDVKLSQIIFQDVNSQDVSYMLHPNAEKDILEYGAGTLIELISSTMEMGHNILCEYNIKQIIDKDGQIKQIEKEKLKEAV